MSEQEMNNQEEFQQDIAEQENETTENQEGIEETKETPAEVPEQANEEDSVENLEEEPVPIEEEPAEEVKEVEEKLEADQNIPKEITESEEAPRDVEEKPAAKEDIEETNVADEEATAKPTTEGHIFALRTTANREDQVMDFLTSNINKKGLNVYSIIRPHGMRGYIFMEAPTRSDAEQACFNVPYARGVLPNEIQYKEIEHMLEQQKQVVNIQKGDIVELISGPFKREKAKISRLDTAKEEVVVELLEAAVPIPITVKLDAVKVIRRDSKDDD